MFTSGPASQWWTIYQLGIFSCVQQSCSQVHHLFKFQRWDRNKFLMTGTFTLLDYKYFITSCCFFLVVHGCFQDPGHLRNNVPQTPVKTPFPYHLLAVETEPGTPNQRLPSWWGCDTGWWHARWLARWKFTWVLNCVTMTTLSIKTYWKIYIGFFSNMLGHSAKYGSYTMMDLTLNKVIDIQLVQVKHW